MPNYESLLLKTSFYHCATSEKLYQIFQTQVLVCKQLLFCSVLQ